MSGIAMAMFSRGGEEPAKTTRRGRHIRMVISKNEAASEKKIRKSKIRFTKCVETQYLQQRNFRGKKIAFFLRGNFLFQSHYLS
jgi:hypothetical protein